MKLLLFTLMMTTSPEADAEARTLYQEGTTLFEAADYEGAIEKFTDALNLVGDEDDEDRHTRLTLLFNIASAHEKQYAIDQDPKHLRQAKTLYVRYRDFAKKHGDIGEELDVETRILRIENELEGLEEPDEKKVPSGAVQDPPRTGPQSGVDASPADTEQRRKTRNTGTALVVAGSLATVGGVVLSVVGSRLEPRARDQVMQLADMGVPMDHEAWAQGDDFIAQERAKGRALIGAGVAVSVVGVVGVGVGSYFLVKSKKLREHEVSITPTWGSGTAGIQIGGRF